MTSSQSHPRVLVIGKDARTDAIAEACIESPQTPMLFALSEIRIPGLVKKTQGRIRTTPSLTDTADVVRIARDVRPDLVIIGPEEPLAAGYADALRALGIRVFGPTERLAAIEYSKSWARALIDRHGIPGNPEYRLFDSPAGLAEYMEQLGSFVVKPDGLTGGKGVRVLGEHLESLEDALTYAEDVLQQTGKVQIEERLEGEEFSLQTITDGSTVIHCPIVQDHKRAFEGDHGPNTGGMGSYSCANHSLPFLDDQDVVAARSVNERVIEALGSESREPYCGVLYGGFIATRDGVRLIEYNSRFGDPEAMNVLPLLDADFVELCASAAGGNLSGVDYSWERKATVCKYIVPREYPSPTPGRQPIVVDDDELSADDVRWYWAACEEKDGEVFLTSSRSGAFVGVGRTVADAEQAAEQAASDLESSSGGLVRHRRDIGRESVIAQRVEHLRSLRAESNLAPGRSELPQTERTPA
jgi:phosphoribosylamine---glycine ligase